jgi:NAD(P)-dependent dehydrogenase (short-subunit alcohol dehydrogenase family)
MSDAKNSTISVDAKSARAKAVLVTGATSGIGQSIAELLVAKGYLVFAGARCEAEKPTEKRELASSSNSLRYVAIDVTDEDSIRTARRFIESQLSPGQPLAIVNNAGVAFGSPFEPEPISEIRLQMEVNYFGPVRVIKEFLPVIRKQGGQIVNMSSISGKSSMPFNGAYCASKFALEAATDALRLELKPWGIPISNVLPGDIQTEIWRKATAAIDAAASQWSDEHKQLYGGTIEFMKNEIRSIDGSPPSDVARAIEKLLRSRRPPARVFVGKNVYLYCFLEWLPTPLRDWLVLRRLAKLKSYQRQPSLGERL